MALPFPELPRAAGCYDWIREGRAATARETADTPHCGHRAEDFGYTTAPDPADYAPTSPAGPPPDLLRLAVVRDAVAVDRSCRPRPVSNEPAPGAERRETKRPRCRLAGE
jgi:hypothetical protein